MKKFTTSVFFARNGSRYAVPGSGNSDMSDSWIAWKPRIDDPSKLSPSENTDSSKEDTGTVKCCITPGRSQNRTSTISTPSSLTYFNSSSAFANMRLLLGPAGPSRPALRDGRPGVGCQATYAGAVSRPYPVCFLGVTAPHGRRTRLGTVGA